MRGRSRSRLVRTQGIQLPNGEFTSPSSRTVSLGLPRRTVPTALPCIIRSNSNGLYTKMAYVGDDRNRQNSPDQLVIWLSARTTGH